MPLYEYQCTACGHRFEIIQKFSDAPVESCPKCGASVIKLQSAPAFQFKGSGWYVTDYAKKDQGSGTAAKGSTNQTDSSSSKAESGGKSGVETAKSESGSTETKAASKPEAPAKKSEN